MIVDINALTDALESTGIFDTAKLLDPEAIVRVAISLANTANPNDYMIWLSMYAGHYGVAVSDLATDVLIILSRCAGFVGPGIARAAESHVRELVAA